MILEPTLDRDLIKSVMTDSEMWGKVGIDGVEVDTFEPVIKRNMIVLSALVESVIGLHMFVDTPKGVIYHPMLLKQFRKNHGREFIKKGIEWIFDQTPTEQIMVEIPTDHRHNINLAKHFNFKELNIKKNGISQRGKLFDLQRLRLDKGDL